MKTRGMVRLCEILPGFGFPEKKVHPVSEAKIIAPRDTPPKVIGDPTRTPVNRQAALLIAPASWIHKPLPPNEDAKPEVERLREENAALKNTNANIVAENAALRKRVDRLAKLVESKRIKPKVGGAATAQRRESFTAKARLLERLSEI